MAGPWEKYAQPEAGPWTKYATPDQPPDQSFGDKVLQQGKNMLGALRGAASIGATLTTPVAQYDQAGNKDPRSFLDRRAATLKEVEDATKTLGADPTSLVYQGTKLGAEVAGTAGAGGSIANVITKAAPRVAAAAPNLMNAVRTTGMTAGPANTVGNLATRSAGGAITGGLSAAAVDPESAGAGALIGGALPVATKVAGVVGRGAGNLIATGTKNALGLSTGVGAEPISQAFKAGKSGSADFMANMKGDVPLTDVLDRAKQGLAAMAAEKSAQYRSGMIPIAGDKTVLSLSGLDKALSDAAAVTAYKGQIKNESAASAVQKMRQIVDEWKSLDPAQFHTPEGLDALKQKLGGILEGIPFQERTARLAAGKVYTAAKDTIESQAPTYAKVMKDYTEASGQISEIERALSLGDKASKDTAMRKLQSLMRNNVQTNYGNRLNLANTLESGGGVELMPSLAGQALSSVTPRSLSGQIGGGATALASLMTGNPAGLALLPFQSPRVVGTMAYGAGKLSGGAQRGANALLGGGQQALPANALQALLQRSDLAQFGYQAAPALAVGR